MKRVLTVLTVLAMLLVAGAIPRPSEASSSDIIIIEDDFDIYSAVYPTFPKGWERLFAAEREPDNNRVTDTTSNSTPNSFQVAGSTTISLAAEALYKLDATPAVIFLEVMVQASGRIKNYDGHESDIWVGFVTRNDNIIMNHVALFFNKDGYICGSGAGALKEYTENEWYRVKIGLDYTEFDVVRANYWIDGAHMGEVALSGPYRDYLEVGSGAEGKGWVDDIKVWTKGNEKPVAEAGDNATYTLEVSQPTIDVELDGSNSTDSDGTIVAYTWTGTPDPDDLVGPNVTLGAGVHIFTLVVTDDDGAMSDPDTVTITVNEAISRCEFQTFTINHMTIDWAKDTDNQDKKWKWDSWLKWFTKSTSKKDDTFNIRGKIKLPKDCTVADLEESATVGVSINDSLINDTVSFKDLNQKKWGVMWRYKGSIQHPGDGINITKITIWWAPQSDKWDGLAWFNIKGVLGFPEDIGMNNTPAEATVTVQIPVSVEDGCRSLLGEETVEFKVSGKSNRWYY